MHPPFYIVDHKVIITPERRFVRRSLPGRLEFQPATCGWPPLAVGQKPVELAPIPPKPFVRLVPPPSGTPRDLIGRWLIRIGQRMILKNRLG